VGNRRALDGLAGDKLAVEHDAQCGRLAIRAVADEKP